MGDTISRQAAILQLSHNKCGNEEWDIAVQYDIETIKQLPSAQPIIRCKDCKYHFYEKGTIPYCSNIDYGYGWKDEDFCSRAERKDNGRLDQPSGGD